MKWYITFLAIVFVNAVTNAQIIKVSNNLTQLGVNAGSMIIINSGIDSSLWRLSNDGSGTYRYSTKAKFWLEDYIDTLDGKVLLTARTDNNGEELWITDGTDAGTSLISDLYPGPENSTPHVIASMNRLVYFTAETPDYGRELWATDGTSTGTFLVKDINPGADGIWISFARIIKNGVLYLIINDMVHGRELWRTDGTENGTFMLKDINKNDVLDLSHSICEHEGQDFVSLGDEILFTAFDGENGYGLWKTDGTEANTVLVALTDTIPGNSINLGSLFFKVNDYFFFNNGLETTLWITDGTSENTKQIKDFSSLYGGSGRINLESAAILNDGFTYMVRSTVTDSCSLWKTNIDNYQTELFFKDSNFLVRNIVILSKYNFYLGTWIHPFSFYDSAPSLNKHIFIRSYYPDRTGKLWVTEGDTVKFLKDFKTLSDEPYYYRYIDNDLYFAAEDNASGNELWKSDGTVNGTTLVSDIRPGPSSSYPFFMFNYQNEQYFAADDGDNNDELYDMFKLGTVLPVTLSNFTVTLKGNDGVLNWQTITEYNTSRFIIQRSNDGVSFEDIATAATRNASIQKQNYAYTDIGVFAALTGTFYYRLLIIDKDGKTLAFSKIVTLKKDGNGLAITLSPNPVKDRLTISYNNNNLQKAILRIADVSGKKVNIINNILPNTSGQQFFYTGYLAKGLYYVQLLAGRNSRTISFVKE